MFGARHNNFPVLSWRIILEHPLTDLSDGLIQQMSVSRVVSLSYTCMSSALSVVTIFHYMSEGGTGTCSERPGYLL